jgi:hypothetical protein
MTNARVKDSLYVRLSINLHKHQISSFLKTDARYRRTTNSGIFNLHQYEESLPLGVEF